MLVAPAEAPSPKDGDVTEALGDCGAMMTGDETEAELVEAARVLDDGSAGLRITGEVAVGAEEVVVMACQGLGEIQEVEG